MAQMIGIVGGVGTFAGIDLLRRIYSLTDARTDQDHLPVALISKPYLVEDRTLYLQGKVKENPGIAIAEIINALTALEAWVVGIPCNTAHAPVIFNEIVSRIPEKIRLLHLIEEVCLYISENHPEIRKVGILGTNGTFMSELYTGPLSGYQKSAIYPEERIQKELVHPAIYNRGYGIKAFSNPVTDRARKDLLEAASSLVRRGAEAIVLGCSEIPLAIHETVIDQCIVIDSMSVLAQALINTSRS
jgi:aspartate racemase